MALNRQSASGERRADAVRSTMRAYMDAALARWD
jgi:hypothetical protein